MYLHFKKKFVLLITVLFVLTGCDGKKVDDENVEIMTIEHAQGKTDVPVNPQKVVVLNTATLDIIDALDIPVTAVPQSSVHLPAFLAKYANSDYQNAGTLFEPNYELLSSIHPDLIIAGGRVNDAYNKLSSIAPTLSLDLDNADFLTSLTQRTEQLGVIFNKQQEAEKLINDFKQKLTQIQEKSRHAGSALVVMINGGKMSAYGPKSRFGFIFDELGFTPATTFEEAGRHGNAVTSEFILSVNPDWLFVLDRDSAIGRPSSESAKQVLNNPLIEKTNAWQQNRIIYLDSTSMYIAGGIQTYNELMDQISSVLK